MAAKKPYYTSNDLIAAVQRSINIPLYQLTYTDEDILAFATEELFLAQVPSIVQFHGEYFVYEQEVSLVASKSKYPIPPRAIGMKLRDVFYKNTSGNLIEMSKVNPDDKAHFQDGSSSSEPIHYYLQNNSIVIVPEVSASVTGSLVYTYYLRPNSLVKNERAIICESFSKTITIDNPSLVNGDTLTIGRYILEAGVDFVIGVNSTTTCTNIVSAINNLNDAYLSASTVSSIITVTHYDFSGTNFSTSNPTGLIISSRTTINSTQAVPSDITAGSLVDFLQTDGGHNTYSMDIRLEQNAVSASGITVLDSLIPEDFVTTDYVCLAGESIIPQVPTDLHVLLAERTCARILSAQGDQAGLQNSNTKIQDYEQRQASVIDSRVDGSPTKVFNRHSLLRYGKSRRNI